MDLSELRQSYTKGSFSEQDLLASPFEQFEKWFQQAMDSQLEEPNAMCLATVSKDGQPSTRIVLLKDFSDKGMTFYTNYESRKSVEIEATGKVAANFLWLPLQRQVNVTGRVERVSKSESLKYFLSRPFGSQLGAWTSPQSKVITSRSVLETKLDQMKRKFAEGKVPLPDHWGGYRIVPDSFEFWQGRPNRLHDRFVYRKDEASQWFTERLAP
ncbi:pyridoxamine 5'-phosphate oxidase [Coraliomargarita sinensis]|uniref:Pyridoxamine 5'-phosphate oxidase n=1 Tax=Coraliomargarita sinensis TaxID=2174842 RepID=A0A317ZH24_9BACT|nr:pyridoxamine 5'-phosphate oxidase [Coraliomargarita sinensis]PXA03089.1 pyridoxamine 5'-phosphate oxidase [Coraliomargarita sinensis]